MNDTLATIFVIMYLIAIVGGTFLLGLCYFTQFSEKFKEVRMPWKEFYKNPGILIMHGMWGYLVIFFLIQYLRR
jgi:hypothetical protein